MSYPQCHCQVLKPQVPKHSSRYKIQLGNLKEKLAAVTLLKLAVPAVE